MNNKFVALTNTSQSSFLPYSLMSLHNPDNSIYAKPPVFLSQTCFCASYFVFSSFFDFTVFPLVLNIWEFLAKLNSF